VCNVSFIVCVALCAVFCCVCLCDVYLYAVSYFSDRFCGLVVRAPGYRSRGSGSILGATRFLDK
jgi:hypothetical protein